MQQASLDNTLRQFPEFGQINARNSFNRKLMPETSAEELILKTERRGKELWGILGGCHSIPNMPWCVPPWQLLLMIFRTWMVWVLWVGPLNESTLVILCQHPSKCCSLAGSTLLLPQPPSPRKKLFWCKRYNEGNWPLRLIEDPNMELLGSCGRPITLYWLPAPGIPVKFLCQIQRQNSFNSHRLDYKHCASEPPLQRLTWS